MEDEGMGGAATLRDGFARDQSSNYTNHTAGDTGIHAKATAGSPRPPAGTASRLA